MVIAKASLNGNNFRLNVKGRSGSLGARLTLGINTLVPVSYTHLDVYKRQVMESDRISLK